MKETSVTILDLGGAGHFGICWASGNLDADNFRVVRDETRVLTSRVKEPRAQTELKNAVLASIKKNESGAVIIAFLWERKSASEKSEAKKLSHAMQVVQEWGLPTRKVIGICFDQEGEARQVGTLEYMCHVNEIR